MYGVRICHKIAIKRFLVSPRHHQVMHNLSLVCSAEGTRQGNITHSPRLPFPPHRGLLLRKSGSTLGGYQRHSSRGRRGGSAFSLSVTHQCKHRPPQRGTGGVESLLERVSAKASGEVRDLLRVRPQQALSRSLGHRDTQPAPDRRGHSSHGLPQPHALQAD